MWITALAGKLAPLPTKKPIKHSSDRLCEPAGTRTQDPYIKSVLLYQLSYGFIFLPFLAGALRGIPVFWDCKNRLKTIRNKFFSSNFFNLKG